MSHQFAGFFLQKLKKVETEKIVFYDVTCDQIEILTGLAPPKWLSEANFCEIYLCGCQKMTRNGCKMSNSHSCGIYMHSDYNLLKNSW